MSDPNVANPGDAAEVALRLQIDALVVLATAADVTASMLPFDARRASVRQTIDAIALNGREARRRLAQRPHDGPGGS
jgi:hypothetical protein